MNDAQHTYFMHTERIGFRLWTEADLPLAIALWSNRQVTELIADLGNPSEHQARNRLAKEVANQNTHGFQYWPVFRLANDQHLGCCGLRPWQESAYEIGAHIFPNHWGQGYATEGLRCVIDFAFRHLAAERLFARHNPKNHRSARTLEKLGFAYSHAEWMPQTGLDHPCYILRPQPGAVGKP